MSRVRAMVRTIVRMLLVLALFVPSLAEAQRSRPVHRVGLVFVASPIAQMLGAEPDHPSVRAFLHELRRLGYIEGENLLFERRSAEGRAERIDGILKELLRLNMDVIVTAGNDVPRLAKQMTNAVPIVMAAVARPSRQGSSRTWRDRRRT
jgi:putative ABC transport system substrate-binding protein